MSYEQDAIRTKPPNEPVTIEDAQLDLLHAAMGLCTESGEFMNAMKRWIYYNKPPDRNNLIEEIGDVFWYCALAAEALGVSFEEIQTRNTAKLKARYPEGFSHTDALNRDLPSELAALEGSE